MSATPQLASIVAHYGYAAVAGAVLAENLGLPVPGETTVFIASGAAAAGHLNVFAIWCVAAIAAIIGDNIGFALGHVGGKPLFERYGPRFGVSHVDYARTELLFDRWGGPAVMVARFIPVARVIGALTAGASGMRWRHFLPWQALGAALWGAYAVSVGYFGDRALLFFKPMLVEEFGRWWWLVLGIALGAALLVVLVVSRVLARRARRATGTDSEPAE